MDKNEFMLNISKGTLRAVMMTIIFMVVYSIMMNFFDFSTKVSSVVYLVTTCLSIVYGAIYASKANNQKGWLTGIMTALVYMILLLVVSSIINGTANLFTLASFIRVFLALAVGTLSGMLGINI